MAETNWADVNLLRTIQVGNSSSDISLDDCYKLRDKWEARGLGINRFVINAISSYPSNSVVVTPADIERCGMRSIPLYWQAYFLYPNGTESNPFVMAALAKWDSYATDLSNWLDFCGMVLPGVDHLSAFLDLPTMKDAIHKVLNPSS